MEWWTWLLLTGFFMACTWASKVNGILTVFCIGVAVLIDLWDILDVRKEGHTMVSPFSLYFRNSYSQASRTTSTLTSWPGLVV
jgi:dolichyl-phosphate-mannose--protein O-mannosyl transferase